MKEVWIPEWSYRRPSVSQEDTHWVFIVISHEFKKIVAVSISNFTAPHSLKKGGLPAATTGATLKIHLGSLILTSCDPSHRQVWFIVISASVSMQEILHQVRLCDLGGIYLVLYNLLFTFINWRCYNYSLINNLRDYFQKNLETF